MLADIHAKTFHGEAPLPLHQHAVQTLQHQLAGSSHLPPKKPPAQKSIPCSVCSAQFFTSQEMLTHVFSSHPQAAEQLRQSYGVPPPVSPGHSGVPPAWPSSSTAPVTTPLLVKCVLCKSPMVSEQALVEHLNQVHGLPGGAVPSQSFHAPLFHQSQANSSQHQPQSQVDQVASLIAQLLPTLTQPHLHPRQPPPHANPHFVQPTQHPLLPPQLGPQQFPQGHSQLPAAFPTGFHAASLFPSTQPRCGSEGKLKSGLDRSVAPSAAVYVLWPHEAFDRVSGQKDFKHYADLTTGALAAGMIRSIMYLPEFSAVPTNIQMQLQHLSTLFHSIVATNNLKAALEFQ